MYKKINSTFEYAFTIQKDGMYVITVEASCKSGSILGLFGGEDLRVEIDGIKLREVPAKNKPQYYNIPPAWNGTKLKGLAKLVAFVLFLAAGEHVLRFMPKRGATIHAEPKIQTFNSQQPLLKRIQAQDGNRRPWITVALIDMPLKTADVAVKCEKRAHDSDDVKLIIDGKIEKNEQAGWWGKNWYWRGSELQGNTKDARFYPDAAKGIHYIELWADRTPALESLAVTIGDIGKKEDTEGKDAVRIKEYAYRGVSGKENYNRYDTEILAAVDEWNREFMNDAYPPTEPLDPNLVKAMIFVESRMGYAKGGEVDVMQVGNHGDDALRTLHHKREETWFQNGERVPLDYEGEANADTPAESITWGVRWLYHKAQKKGVGDDWGWRSWQEAMEGYGPQEKEHNKAIWSIYKDGADTRQGKRIRLWSFALFALLFTLLLNYGLFKPNDNGRVLGTMHEDANQIAINEYREVDRRIAEAFAQYQNQPANTYWELFSPLRTLCEHDSCARTLAVDYLLAEYLDDLISRTASPRELLSVMADMDVLEPHTWEYQDIDNDGEKELVLVDLDRAGHNFLDLVVIDVVNGAMTRYDKRFEDYQYFGSPDSLLRPVRPLRLLDITGDTIPEILIFGSWGRMGTRLHIVQYDSGMIDDREFVNDFAYPVYTFYDIDSDGIVEISVSGQDPCSFGTFAYSCDEMYKDAIIEYDLATDAFVYHRI